MATSSVESDRGGALRALASAIGTVVAIEVALTALGELARTRAGGAPATVTTPAGATPAIATDPAAGNQPV